MKKTTAILAMTLGLALAGAAYAQQKTMTWFIRIILWHFSQCGSRDRKTEHSREVEAGKSQSLNGKVMRRRSQLTELCRS